MTPAFARRPSINTLFKHAIAAVMCLETLHSLNSPDSIMHFAVPRPEKSHLSLVHLFENATFFPPNTRLFKECHTLTLQLSHRYGSESCHFVSLCDLFDVASLPDATSTPTSSSVQNCAEPCSKFSLIYTARHASSNVNKYGKLTVLTS